jgi:GT2 family glycosyltransferase
VATLKFLVLLLLELFWPPRAHSNIKKVRRVIAEGGLGELPDQIKAYLRWVAVRSRLYPEDPDARYALWIRRHEPQPGTLRGQITLRLSALEARRLRYRPRFSIVMPVFNPRLEDCRAAVESVRAQCYPEWELCIADDGSTDPAVRHLLEDYAAHDPRIKVKFLGERRGIAGASNAALGLATGDFVAFLDHDDELAPWALYEVARALNAEPDLDVIYSDEDKLDEQGRRTEPFFKPEFSPETLLSMNYIGHLLVIRRRLVEAVGGFRVGFDGSQDHDLVLRVTERTSRVRRIPKVLYHWRKAEGSAARDPAAKPFAAEAGVRAVEDALRRRGFSGTVEPVLTGLYRIRRNLRDIPLVSIIVPTRDQADILKRCVRSIFNKSTYRNWELLVIDNQSREPETLEFFAEISRLPNVRILKYNAPFNFAKINNLGAAEARGDVLLFLNNDVEVVTPSWLEELLGFALQPEIGAVGAKLLLPDGRIQHGGVVLGLSGGADHAFYGLPADHPGYFRLAMVARNCSAVTAACLMTRREVFEKVGGFDPVLHVAFNDVDLCLRILAAGYRVVWTPFAVLYHYESTTRRKAHPVENTRYLLKKWGDRIRRGDPYYNPNLALDSFDFRIRM